MERQTNQPNMLQVFVLVVAIVLGIATATLGAELAINQIVRADAGGSGSDNNPCSGNPHDRDSGQSGNPHDNNENGNPHDDGGHHGESDNCPGS